MYLDVTQQVESRLSQGFFADSTFMETLDVVFANIYFGAVDAAGTSSSTVPPAWQPLIQARSNGGIYPIPADPEG